MKNGLTLSMIFEAQSANYGEGMGNITTLKKLNRGIGEGYTYISRQAIRYNIVEQLGWDTTPVSDSGSDKTVVQFKPDATIVDYPEIDLFGYMKTEKKQETATRSAVCRLSNAVSLEPFTADLDFLTNMGLAKRGNKGNSIAQSEIHKSFYAYTITIDLDRVGIDQELEISLAQRSQRIEDLLITVQYLYRDIKGRRENFAPVFVIGGLYERKSPFFENRLQLQKGKLDVERIKAVREQEFVAKDTHIGYLSGSFSNDQDIKENLAPQSVEQFFAELIAKVKERFA